MNRNQSRDPVEHTARVAGWGADLDPKDRPGVPMQDDPPAPRAGAHWKDIPRQTPRVEVLQGPHREEPTPVVGTSTPPRLLSGLVKRMAYRYPDWKTRRWLLLLLSDRLDVWENRVDRAVMPAAALVVGGLYVLMLRRTTARV